MEIDTPETHLAKLHGNAGAERFRKNWFWPMFMNPCVEAEYTAYKIMIENSSSMLTTSVYLILYAVICGIIFIKYRNEKTFATLDVLFKIGVVISSISIGLHAFYSTYHLLSYFRKSFKNLISDQWKFRLRDACVVSVSLMNSLFLVGRCLHGKCEGGEFSSCNATPDAIPPQGYIVVLLPIYTSVIYRGNFKFSVIFVVTLINYTALIASTFIVKLEVYFSIVMMILSVLLYACLMLAAHKDMTTFEYYFASQKYFKQQIEQTQNQAELEHKQLKMILANVAHDLKTPLTAFEFGLQNILQIARKTQCQMRRTNS
jgi:hypothetical protein